MTYGGPQLEYEAVPTKEATEGGNEETSVVMMIETPEAVQNSGEIAAVDGVDVLLVGGSDLSTTMGIPGQSTNPDFLAAVDKVIASAHDAGKIAGLGGVYDEGILPDFVNRGMRFFLGGADMSFILAGGKSRGSFFNNLKF